MERNSERYTVDDKQTCITQNKEYTIIPIV